MTQERIQDIHEYREATRAGMDLPDVKYAHEAIDELLDAVKVAGSQIEAVTQQRDYGRDVIAGMQLEAQAAADIVQDHSRKLDAYRALVKDLLASHTVELPLKNWLSSVSGMIEAPAPAVLDRAAATNAAVHELAQAAQQQFTGLKPFPDGSPERL